MKRSLVVIRGGEAKLRLPNAEIRSDGTIWYNGVPLCDGLAADALPKEQVAAIIRATAWDKLPLGMWAHMGTSASGLTVMLESERDDQQRADRERQRAAYLSVHPGAEARREIDELCARADRLERSGSEDNVSGPIRLRAEARERLAEWRTRYPVEDREEEAIRLRGLADRQRELAAGALTYDADGSLTAEMQQQRHDGHMGKAGDLDRQAAELEDAK